MSRVNKLLENLLAGEPFAKVPMFREEIEEVMDKVRNILLERPMLLELNAPIIIMGDIHGQFYDMLNYFKLVGVPGPNKQFVGLGDYIDRGSLSLETIMLLLSLKVKFPDDVHLLRGNHETMEISRIYGFHQECMERFDMHIYKRFNDIFDCMPVAALINNKILCMHGGISPHLNSLDDIRRLSRPSKPTLGLFTDLMWSDPTEMFQDGWCENSRGVSFLFGSNQVQNMCTKLDIDIIIRAHQVVLRGYQTFANGKMLTLFSAPNFCGCEENMGAILLVDANLTMKLVVLDARIAQLQEICEESTAILEEKGDLSNANKTMWYKIYGMLPAWTKSFAPNMRERLLTYGE